MVNQTLYFGTLQLNVNTPCSVSWREEEKNFFIPSLQSCKSVNVDVDFVNVLTIPQSKCVRKSSGQYIFKSKMEERVYIPTYAMLQYPSTYSCLKEDHVVVYHMNDGVLWGNPNFYILTMIHIEKLLLDVGALILHSCYMEYQNEAILFTAPSGTGKTTQANLWKRIYGSIIVNGDKCLLQKCDDGFKACGFFLHGSAEECENRSLPIKVIVIVRQSKKDYIEELSAAQKIGLLYSEITVNDWDSDYVNETLNLLEQLVKHTKVVILHCTMQDNAAYVLHEYLYGGRL